MEVDGAPGESAASRQVLKPGCDLLVGGERLRGAVTEAGLAQRDQDLEVFGRLVEGERG